MKPSQPNLARTDADFQTEFRTLVEIVARLRGPNGCPWDLAQTPQSLTAYIVEEAYELVEAIEQGSAKDVCEELGDFLFQVVLQAQLAADAKQFQIQDVLAQLNAKLIRRHPHVFAQTEQAAAHHSLEDIWKNWQLIKNSEKSKAVGSVAEEIRRMLAPTKGLPALQVASKIGRKTKNYGFDWDQPEQVLAKVQEELHEVQEALTTARNQGLELDKAAHLEAELGDLLFSTAQLVRHIGLDPESVLRKANQHFTDRFSKTVLQSGLSSEAFTQLPAERKEDLWRQVKSEEAKLKS